MPRGISVMHDEAHPCRCCGSTIGRHLMIVAARRLRSIVIVTAAAAATIPVAATQRQQRGLEAGHARLC